MRDRRGRTTPPRDGRVARFGRRLVRRLARSLAPARLRRREPEVRSTINDVRREGLTYLDANALLELRDTVRDIERAGVEGSLIEAGCARGGSAIVLASAKDSERELKVYDTFGLIPPPSERDGSDAHRRYEVISEGSAGDDYYGYDENLLAKVREAFEARGLELERENVELIQGTFEEALAVSGPVAMAHIDCDWYGSVMTCLERIEPNLAPGGVLVIDDYDSWSGARRAVNDYFRERDVRFVQRSRLHVVKP